MRPLCTGPEYAVIFHYLVSSDLFFGKSRSNCHCQFFHRVFTIYFSPELNDSLQNFNFVAWHVTLQGYQYILYKHWLSCNLKIQQRSLAVLYTRSVLLLSFLVGLKNNVFWLKTNNSENRENSGWNSQYPSYDVAPVNKKTQ